MEAFAGKIKLEGDLKFFGLAEITHTTGQSNGSGSSGRDWERPRAGCVLTLGCGVVVVVFRRDQSGKWCASDVLLNPICD